MQCRDLTGEGGGGGGGGEPFQCFVCYVPLTPALAMAADPDGYLVPYLQAVEMYEALPPLKDPIDPNDPRDWGVMAFREAIPVCRGCAKKDVENK